MAEVRENREAGGVPVRPIDWQSRQVWVTSLAIALGLGALGGVACALADPLLAYRTSSGEELAAAVWSPAATLVAFGGAAWIALRWQVKYGGAGDPSTIIITGDKKKSGSQASLFLMMGLWILVVLAVGAVVLAVFDLFLAIRSSPGARALALGGFGFLGLPLLFWILGEQAQARKAG